MQVLRGRWADANMPRYAVLVTFLLLCTVGGGSSRGDVLSLLYLRPAAVLALALLAVLPGRWDFAAMRVPLALLGCLALTIAVQLIPLPPALWTALPGHARFAPLAEMTGMAQPWRPITLSPDRTVNSLLALLPALVVLVGFAGLGARERASLLLAPIIIALVSAVLAIAQLGAGTSGAFQLYTLSNIGGANGFFANRNHEAALLALALPCLAAWVGRPAAPATTRLNALLGLAAAVLLLPMIVVTGSRAGVVVGAVAFVLALAMLVPVRRRLASGRSVTFVLAGALLIPVMLVVLALMLGRAASVDRLLGQSIVHGEQRVDYVPILLAMVKTYLPFGTGFGAFDPAFRIAEPDWALQRTYFNHAHDDPLELLLTGGIAALLVLVAAVVWWLWRTRRLAQTYVASAGSAGAVGLAGAASALLLLLASFVDYPVRTPLLTAILAIAAGLTAMPTRNAENDALYPQSSVG